MSESAFGVDHGHVSKMYEESRLATPEEAKTLPAVKKPGRITSTLMPKKAEKMRAAAKVPAYATKTDEWAPGKAPLITRGKPGSGKDVTRFSRLVGGE